MAAITIIPAATHTGHITGIRDATVYGGNVYADIAIFVGEVVAV